MKIGAMARGPPKSLPITKKDSIFLSNAAEDEWCARVDAARVARRECHVIPGEALTVRIAQACADNRRPAADVAAAPKK